MKKFIILLLLGINTCFAQESDSVEIKAVQQVLLNLFQGMKSGDSTLVHSCFTPNPTLQSFFIHPRSGKTQINTDPLQDFLNVVGMPHEKQWDEVPLSFDIKIDNALMATAWVPYTFFLGGNYQHEGVDAFILVKVDGKWKIAILTDTRRVKKQ